MNNSIEYNIFQMTLNDIPEWLSLSHEFDKYIIESHFDIDRFYSGFDEYMIKKIEQNEAFKVVANNETEIAGIAAISRHNNRITFFGVAHSASFDEVGEMLIAKAIDQLDRRKGISISILQIDPEFNQKEEALIKSMGFIRKGEKYEENIPAIVFTLLPNNLNI